MLNSRLSAPAVAFLAPLVLYGGALVSQFGFGLHPCEMCYWQRWPHQAAIILALLALILRGNDKAMRALTLLAAVAIAISGGLACGELVRHIDVYGSERDRINLAFEQIGG